MSREREMQCLEEFINIVTCMLWAIWHVLTTVAMATNKHATMGNHATVEAFSLWSVPVMSLRGVFFGV
jgi:hypothetical protein